jgi:hypothetical protein
VCEGATWHGHIDDGGRWEGFEGDAFNYPHITRLADPASWLPASAWEDREIKSFVPSEYDIFINGGPPADPAVQELVDAKDWECQADSCYTAFTTDEARALAEALDAAGFKADIGRYKAADYLEYHDPDNPTGVGSRIDFWARLPQRVGLGPVPGA